MPTRTFSVTVTTASHDADLIPQVPALIRNRFEDTAITVADISTNLTASTAGPKVMYAITGTVETRPIGSGVIGWAGTRQVPTFYLDADVQGITDAEHAVRIARTVVDPLGTIPAGRIHLHAEPLTQRPTGWPDIASA